LCIGSGFSKRAMQLLKNTIVTIATLLSLVFGIAVAYAHGDEASWEVVSGEYTVDVGYEPEEFVVGRSTRFEFNLKQGSGEEAPSTPFAEVWVRLRGVDATYFATGVRKQELGPTTLLYAFGKPGHYTLEVSFRDEGGKEVAAASLPISVADGEKGAVSSGWLTYFVLGVVAGVVLASLFSTIRKLRKS